MTQKNISQTIAVIVIALESFKFGCWVGESRWRPIAVKSAEVMEMWRELYNKEKGKQ